MPEAAITTGSTPAAPSAAPAAAQPAANFHAPNPRSVGHSPARDLRAASAARVQEVKDAHDPAAAAATAAARQVAPAPAIDPAAASLNTEKHKIGGYEISESELAAMMTRQAAEDLRKTQVPATPADYKIKMDAVTPVGVDAELVFDQSDPMAKATLDAAREYAHSKNMSQTEFSELLGLYANGKAAEMSIINRAAGAERTKLGALGGQRIDAVCQWIRGEAGEINAKTIVAGVATAAQVEFFEKIMTRLTSQNTASFSQQHRAAPEANAIPGYETMSFEQRRYAQDQLAARRNSR